MKAFFTFLMFNVFLYSSTLAQTYPAAALWELTNPADGGTGFSASLSGQVTAEDQSLSNMELNQYTGPEGSQRLRILGNAWPANQTEPIENTYIQYVIAPKTNFTLVVDSLSLKMAITSINEMKANIYYSTDAGFSTPTQLEYSTGLSNNYLSRDALSSYSLHLPVVVNSGEALYVRIYPWVDNDPDERTGKYICIKDLKISGQIESNIVPAAVEWPFDTDSEPLISGSLVAEGPQYSDSLKWYGIADETHPADDTQEDLNFGAIQTVSQIWTGQSDSLSSHWFQFKASPKFGGTFYVDSIFMYLGAWFTEDLRAVGYYATDASFSDSKILFADSPLNGTELEPFALGTSDTLQTGESIYIRIYPYNTQSQGWAKLVAVSNVKIIGQVDGVTADPPQVETAAVEYISTTFASAGGNIPADGGLPVISRGVVWNTNGSPTIADSKTLDGTGSGSFNSHMTGLSAGTQYYLRAYATNNAGTSYGQEIPFSTLDSIDVPTVTTMPVTEILVKTAASGGQVTSWGGDTIVVRGVCWNTSGSPTIADNKTENGSGLGSFESVIYPLQASTKYYVRAYATNAKGSGYGSEREFTTQSPAADITKVVALDGSGDYTSVQDAFDEVPDFYTGKYTIFVKNGVYYEKLFLDRNKVNVTLQGESRDSTILTYDDYAGKENVGTSGSYSVAIDADDFTAITITFRNTIKNDGSFSGQQAVALRTNGDRQAYYYCNMLGYQDTYYTWGGRGTGRIYNKNCYIEGSVDFIFGRDIAVFDSCTININRNGGTLTAAATELESKFGYVFLDCKITSDPLGFDGAPITSFVLGRPWQKSPRTVFIRCEEPSTLSAAGWSSWNVDPGLYAEYKCYGAGSATNNRISISRQLSDEEAQDYTLANIFSKESNPRYGYDWMPEIITGLRTNTSENTVPTDFRLNQNYPNPFNPETHISFTIPVKSRVKISIYDVTGKLVTELLNEYKLPGRYNISFDGKNLASGLYFYRLEAGKFIARKKMIFLK